MGKNKTYTVQFVDQRLGITSAPATGNECAPYTPSSLPKVEHPSSIKRGAILPFSIDEDLYSDVEVLTVPLVVELQSDRGIPACINKSQFIALNAGDRVTIPTGSKVRFDSLRNQVVIIDGITTRHRIPQGFVVIFSDSLYFSHDQSIRFTNCAGFVPIGSSFKVAITKIVSITTTTIEEVNEDLLIPIATASIVSMN